MQLPADDGYMGALSNHAPFLCLLQPGMLYIRDIEGNEIRLVASGGFCEISDNHVIILADAAEPVDEVDVERSKNAVDRAWQRLSIGETEDVDRERAVDALARALNRLNMAEKYGKS